jgi:ABC-2 type transport system ATP-binding protein
VLLTTQYLEEADQLAHRIAVIDHGKLIAEGTSAQLKASVGSAAVQLRLVDPDDRDAAESVLARILDVAVERSADPAALAARVTDSEAVAALLPALAAAGVAVAEFSLGQPSLDEVFLALTGEPTHVAVTEDVA